jgi:hypothetical protein
MYLRISPTADFVGGTSVRPLISYLTAGEKQSELAAIRHCTYTGRPLGTTEFIRQLEHNTQRRLAAQKGGHPWVLNENAPQGKLTFGA